MKVLLILPIPEFDQNQFLRTIDVIKYRWGEVEIVVGILDFLVPYYAENKLNNINNKIIISSMNHAFNITQEFIDKHQIHAVVTLRNKDDKNPPVTWDANISASVYRPFLFGEGGLRCAVKEKNDTQNRHIFEKLFLEIPEGFMFFPYGYIYKNNNFGDINEIGFRLPQNWKELKNRESSHKLIVFVGGSSCFDIFAMIGERFSDILEKKLNDSSKKERYTVLNFGMPGNVVLNEMITYMLYIWNLKPDILIAHDGYNDLSYGQSSDGLLQREYDITYQYNCEKWAKLISGNDIDLDWEIYGKAFVKNSALMVIKAYFNRKKQFEAMVKEHGGIFISALQPALFSKGKAAKEELFYSQKLQTLEQDMIGLNLPLLYEKFLQYQEKHGGFEYFLDFHTIFNAFGEDKIIFGDKVHTLRSGNKVIAQIYFEFLKNKGLI